MAEIIQRDGTWAFDGSTVRITPGLHRSVVLSPPPEKDPFALDLWGSARRDLLTALVATAVTAVTARLPHPSTRGTADDPGARRRAEPAVSPQPAPTTTTSSCAACGSWANSTATAC